MLVDGAHLAAGAVLDPWLPQWAVLGDERDEVAFAQAVVDAGESDLLAPEFSALGSLMLCTGIEAVDLLLTRRR